MQGRIHDFWKGCSYIYMGDSLRLFYHIFLKYPIKMKMRPNYFIFIGYLKTEAGRGSSEPPYPFWVHHWDVEHHLNFEYSIYMAWKRFHNVGGINT